MLLQLVVQSNIAGTLYGIGFRILRFMFFLQLVVHCIVAAKVLCLV